MEQITMEEKIMTTLEKYRQYKLEKQKLLETCTSTQEYEEKIKELCKKLKI